MDSLAPLSVEYLRDKIDISHRLVRDPLALDRFAHRVESRPRHRGRDQCDHDLMGHKRFAPPVLSDESE